MQFDTEDEKKETERVLNRMRGKWAMHLHGLGYDLPFNAYRPCPNCHQAAYVEVYPAIKYGKPAWMKGRCGNCGASFEWDTTAD